MAREFIVPGEIISGSGALDMAENALKLLGKKALIVTDKVMIDLGNCAKVEKALTNQGIEYSIYSDICGEPTDTMIDRITGSKWRKHFRLHGKSDRCKDAANGSNPYYSRNGI